MSSSLSSSAFLFTQVCCSCNPTSSYLSQITKYLITTGSVVAPSQIVVFTVVSNYLVALAIFSSSLLPSLMNIRLKLQHNLFPQQWILLIRHICMQIIHTLTVECPRKLHYNQLPRTWIIDLCVSWEPVMDSILSLFNSCVSLWSVQHYPFIYA